VRVTRGLRILKNEVDTLEEGGPLLVLVTEEERREPRPQSLILENVGENVATEDIKPEVIQDSGYFSPVQLSSFAVVLGRPVGH